ncbi:hypothetical protein ACFP7A_05015 [Sporolactobacillus kofuensis]|uniref:Glucuronosyltransferase n=1 Tax=Sporolactobacillus kofuensis TaxID=269672 RepID=A0ABW1WC64_9BACL
MRKLHNDIGYILQSQSLAPDSDQFKTIYKHFSNMLPSAVQREVDFLRTYHVDLVIGDIPPAPFRAAQIVGIPSIGISNFAWYTAYMSFLDNTELQPLYNCYVDMDYFFSLAGNDEKGWGHKGNQSFDFFSRSPEMELYIEFESALTHLTI